MKKQPMEQNSEDNESVHKQRKPADILFLPGACLMRLSGWSIFIFTVTFVLLGIVLYHSLNFNFWGLMGVDFSEFVFSKNFEEVNTSDSTWSISYENNKYTIFTGTIRHASPIRLPKFPFLTHDILITSGDFADPEKVSTSVFNHMFTWKMRNEQQPQGRINLLHTVPANEEIYNRLWTLQKGQQISISGYEILRISALDPKGGTSYFWEDRGCNTILITEISTDGE